MCAQTVCEPPSISISIYQQCRSGRKVCRSPACLTTQCRESSASPPVTRYSVFFWLLIFHTSPLTVSWWSLSLYMVKAWLRSASSTARNYYFQCKPLLHRARRTAACKKWMCLFKYAPRCTMAVNKVFLFYFFPRPQCVTQEILIFFSNCTISPAVPVQGLAPVWFRIKIFALWSFHSFQTHGPPAQITRGTTATAPPLPVSTSSF